MTEQLDKIIDLICFHYHYRKISKYQKYDHYLGILLIKHLNIYWVQSFTLQLMMMIPSYHFY